MKGWGEIAKKLGFKLWPVISGVEKVGKGSSKDIEKMEREKGELMEKHEMERPERPEMPTGRGR